MLTVAETPPYFSIAGSRITQVLGYTSIQRCQRSFPRLFQCTELHKPMAKVTTHCILACYRSSNLKWHISVLTNLLLYFYIVFKFLGLKFGLAKLVLEGLTH